VEEVLEEHRRVDREKEVLEEFQLFQQLHLQEEEVGLVITVQFPEKVYQVVLAVEEVMMVVVEQEMILL
tara:strand:+ start:189 stop:395 length:207 start_codon:yes stop_codon:yes gene_type:complete